MSEEGGGKIRNKRQHGPSKPYQRNKSIFGKMKELITPSWFSSLVTSKQQEDEEPDDNMKDMMMSSPPSRQKPLNNDTRPPPVFVPLDKRNGEPNKLMAPPQSTFISHTKLNQREATHIMRQDPALLQDGFTSSQLPLIPEKMNEHSKDDDNVSDKSVDSKSTSGCSSMIPHPPSTSQKERVLLELNESDLDTIKDKLLDADDKPKPKVGRSLTWTAQYNTKRPKKPALKGKPSFDVSLFGSPLAGNTSLPSDRLNESTFYPGRTTYGGAASQRRLSLNATAPYQSSPFPVRQKMKARPMNNSFSATTSGTAKKILETLEKMTTPLGDARKIPVDDTVMQSLGSSFSFTPSSYRRPTRHSIGSYMNSSRELQIPTKGPPLKKVSTPGSASLASNLQRYYSPEPQRNFSNTEATPSYQLPGSSLTKPSVSSSGGNQGGKMKSKKFSQHISSQRDEEEEQPYEIPQLRTDFTLPVRDMPSFNFSMPKSSPQFPAKPAQESSSQLYKFSSPIQKMPASHTDTPTGPPKTDFKFSSPIQGDSSTTPKTKSVKFCLDEDKVSNFPPKVPVISSSAFSGASISQGVIKPSPSSSDSSGGGGGGVKVASELKTGSVMDILGGKTDKPTTGNKSSDVPKTDSLSKFASKGWTCDVCLIPNKDDVDKCVACTTPKPGAKASVSTAGKTENNLSAFCTKGWTCDACLVSNKDDVDKCIACENEKPGAKKSLIKSKSASGDSLQSVFKKPTGNWDCDVCLVPNKGEVTKCIACESPRPGTQPSSSGGFKIAPGAFSGQSGFVFGSGSNSSSNSGESKPGSGFKFESNTSTSQPATGFKFGDTAVKISDSSEKPKSGFAFQTSQDENATPTGGFVFGKSSTSLPNSNAVQSGFKFGDAKDSPSDKSGKNNSGFSFGKSASESVPSGGFAFGKPNSIETSTNNIKDSKLNSIDTSTAVSPTTSETETKLSVTTSTIATTGLAFTSKSDSESKPTNGGFKFGQTPDNKKSIDTKTTNGGFFFNQTSNKDNITSDKSNLNSLVGNNISYKTGNDSKMSANSFSGTNNSGFSFNKQEDTKEDKTLFNNQSSTSPSLKRGREDETPQSDIKKPFAPTASPGLFQFGAKSTATTTASSSGGFAFGQNKDGNATGFGGPSMNFGGPATTTSTNTTNSLFAGSNMSTGAVFGTNAPATTASTGASFVFGESSSKPAPSIGSVGAGQQTSIFGSTTGSFGTTSGGTPAFGSSNKQSFGNGFGSPAPAFGSKTVSPPFGVAPLSSAPSFMTPATSSVPAFGNMTTTPSFGNPQTSVGPVFGVPQKTTAPVFGSAQTSFGASATPACTSSTGGFNFSATPSFNFGQPAANTPQPPAAGIFQFGGSKPTETAAPAPTGGFNFGQSASTPVGATFNFSATPTPAVAPNFTATPTPAAMPSFGSFGQPSTPQQGGAGMFNIGASGNTDNRKMKKAVRKIRR